TLTGTAGRPAILRSLFATASFSAGVYAIRRLSAVKIPFAGAGVAGRPAAAPVAAGIDMCRSVAAGLKVAARVSATGAAVPATVRRAIIGLAIIGPVMIMGFTAVAPARAGAPARPAP